MTKDRVLELAVAAGIIPWTKHEHIGGNNFSASDEGLDGDLASLIQFAKLVEAEKQAEIETLYAMYKQACEQRDVLMDQQRAQIAAMRGKLQ